MTSEYECKVFLVEFYLTKPCISFNQFIEMQEEKFKEIGRERCLRLKGAIDALPIGQQITDMMKVKYIFFDWLIYEEESCVLINGHPRKEIPGSWISDATRDYVIHYFDKEFDVMFGALRNNGIGVYIQDPTESKFNIVCPLYKPPTFNTYSNESERSMDNKRVTGITLRFTSQFRPLFLRAATRKKSVKRLHKSNSSGSIIPGHPND